MPPFSYATLVCHPFILSVLFSFEEQINVILFSHFWDHSNSDTDVEDLNVKKKKDGLLLFFLFVCFCWLFMKIEMFIKQFKWIKVFIDILII